MEVFQYRSDAMRRINKHVSHAYTNYTSGQVAREKAHDLTLKFVNKYEIDRNTQQRYRAKKKGLSNSHLVMLAEKNSDVVLWWLLVTDGDGAIHGVEKLKNAIGRKTRIEYQGYELVKKPRRGDGLQPAWTWAITKENKEAWRERLQVAVRAKDPTLMKQALYSLKRTQGFAESRRDAFKLFNETKAYWKKMRKTDWPYGDIFVGFHGKHTKAITIDCSELTTKRKKKTVK